MNENQFTWRSSQNYTLSYYHLTFCESNRLIVSVICAWLSIKAISITTKKQNNWTTSCTQNKARGRLWLESVTKQRDRKCSTWRMRRRFAAVFHSLALKTADPAYGRVLTKGYWGYPYNREFGFVFWPAVKSDIWGTFRLFGKCAHLQAQKQINRAYEISSAKIFRTWVEHLSCHNSSLLRL